MCCASGPFLDRLHTKFGRVLVFVAMLGAVLVARPDAASAQTITVTTTADETIANGQISLREAFALANANGQNDTIQLQAGAHYVIDFCAAGPLTHSDTHALTIQGGAGTTLQNTCADMQTVVDTDGTAGLTINSLEMSGFFVDDGATVHGAAVRMDDGGTLVLSGVEIHGFSSGPGGSIVDGGNFGMHASILSSEIWGSQGTGVKLSFGSLWLNDSQVHHITGNAVSLVDGSPVTISGSSVSNNHGSGVSTTGQGSTSLTVTDSHIDFNDELGLNCGACGSVAIARSNINGNGATTTTGGGGVRATWDYDSPDDAPVMSITDSTIAFNRAVRQGAGVNRELHRRLRTGGDSWRAEHLRLEHQREHDRQRPGRRWRWHLRGDGQHHHLGRFDHQREPRGPARRVDIG